MSANRTELIFILDRSGSMHGLEADTIGGFNRVLDDNRQLEGEASITTILFDHEVQLLHDRLPLAAIRPLTSRDYQVGGSTALLDAVGYAIDKIEGVQKALGKENRAERVQFVIITDGMENASRKYILPQIRSAIARHQEQDGWDFLFLGAGIDAIDTAAQMAIPSQRAVTVMGDSEGVYHQYEAVSAATRAFRKNSDRSAAWKDEVEGDYARRSKR